MKKVTSNLGVASVLCVVLFTFTAVGLAQDKATLTGIVTDSGDRSPLPGANIVLVGTTIGAASSGDGNFTVDNIPPGTYTVKVSFIGYETNETAGVVFVAGETKTINFSLVLTGIQFNPIVATASRRPEKALDAPASISVIELREITQDVAPSSSSILRNVTGVDMAQTGVDRREIVMRGFNNAFSGESYVLTDNRQSAVASLGVNLHSIMPNMNADLDKIEIVRGPGAALYGAGVDEGVIHYLTKDPLTNPGTTFSFSGGERSAFAGQFRHAGVVNSNVGYKITGQYAQANDWKLNPDDPDDKIQLDQDNASVERNYDYQKINVNGMLKFSINDNTSLTFNGGYSQLDAVVLSGIGTLQADGFGYTYGQIRFQSGNFFAQTYINKNNVGDSFVYGTGDDLVDNSTLFNAQAQYNLEMADGKQKFTMGVDYDRTTPDTEGTIYGRFEDSDLISETGGYIQSQTAISPLFDLTLALRGDYNNLQDEFIFSPRVAAVFKPTPTHSFRATYNRAFASPGNTENFLDIVARDPDASLPITIRGMGAARGFTFGRNPAFSALAGSDLIAYSLNPASLGAPQPVGLPLDAVYGTLYAGLAALTPAQLKGLVPALAALPDATVLQLVGLMDPSLTVVQGFSKGALATLDVSSGQTNPVQDVVDIQPLKRNTTNTFELGYKGVIQDRVLFAVDGYYTNKKDFVGPLLMETPFVFVPTLSADLTTALAAGISGNATLAGALTGLGLDPATVATLFIDGAAGQLPDATTPVAIVTPNENSPQLGGAPELLLAYRNFGEVDFWGIDVSLQVVASDRLSLFGNMSIVSDDLFDNEELNETNTDLSVALNAPSFKTKFGFNYSVPQSFSVNASGRYTKGFPVESGPYVGPVDNYFLLDIGAGYDLGRYASGMRFDILVQNVLDNAHREFVGAPKLGRFTMVRLTYTR